MAVIWIKIEKKVQSILIKSEDVIKNTKNILVENVTHVPLAEVSILIQDEEQKIKHIFFENENNKKRIENEKRNKLPLIRTNKRGKITGDKKKDTYVLTKLFLKQDKDNKEGDLFDFYILTKLERNWKVSPLRYSDQNPLHGIDKEEKTVSILDINDETNKITIENLCRNQEHRDNMYKLWFMINPAIIYTKKGEKWQPEFCCLTTELEERILNREKEGENKIFV